MKLPVNHPQQYAEITDVITLIPDRFPVHLHKRLAILDKQLKNGYTGRWATRQMKRSVQRDIINWVEANVDTGYIRWSAKTFTLIESSFPSHLRGQLYLLAKLANALFSSAPATPESLYQIMDFVDEWIEINTPEIKSKLKTIHDGLFDKLKDTFQEPGMPATAEDRAAAIQVIREYITQAKTGQKLLDNIIPEDEVPAELRERIISGLSNKVQDRKESVVDEQDSEPSEGRTAASAG
jgi:hypothetical protein